MHYDFYDGNTNYEAPQLVSLTWESNTTVAIEFDKFIVPQSEVTFGTNVYTVRDQLFTLQDGKTSKVSKVEVMPNNQKKIKLTFTGKPIHKGDRLTYILGDTYQNMSLPYSGPWIIDANTGVGAVGFTSVIN